MDKSFSRLLKCKYCDWTTPRHRGCYRRLMDHAFTHREAEELLIRLMKENLVLDEMEDRLQEQQLIC